MQTRVSAKGQVVLPGPIRRRLGIHAGDLLDAAVHRGRILLTPCKTHLRKARILADPLTGLPVLSVGPEAPLLSSKQVEEML